MQQQDIELLISKYLRGLATKTEEDIIHSWYRTQNNREADVEWKSNTANEEELLKGRMLAKINEQIAPRRSKSYKRLYWGAAAAAVILMVFSAGLYLFSNTSADRLVNNKIDIGPGTNKAILILADGSKIALNDADTGLIARESGISIRKTADGQLVYDASGKIMAGEETAINTIETPRGGQFMINLPDGSKVWLNAASRLTFPAAFKGNERRVELIGEAYFEIAKDKDAPFTVVSGKQAVEVLGTHFNINSYSDESSINTTLLEGSIKISDLSSGQSLLLKPGEQARVGEGIEVSAGDSEAATAWKEGYFKFNNEDIGSIMRKLSRWYDLDISYQKDFTNHHYIGTISRFENVSQVLEMLELTGTIHFKAQGRRITVMP